MVEVSASDETIIYKEILFTPGFACRIGLAHKTLNIHIICLLSNMHQFGIVLVAE